jgi:hypothetical protein
MAGENIMDRDLVRWRKRRVGHEREDHEYNLALAERLLNSRLADDFVIAVDQVGWRLVPRSPAVVAGLKRRLGLPFLYRLTAPARSPHQLITCHGATARRG